MNDFTDEKERFFVNRFVAEIPQDVSLSWSEEIKDMEMPDIRSAKLWEKTHEDRGIGDPFVGSEDSVTFEELDSQDDGDDEPRGEEKLAASLFEMNVNKTRKAPGTIYSKWLEKAEKSELAGSGMPSYMQKIVEGKEIEYESEMVDFCKLAGLGYRTSKEIMRQEIEQIKSDLFDAYWQAERKLNKLCDSYRQLGEV